eukprot:350288-Chlamydomonas_euryale.AAC.6
MHATRCRFSHATLTPARAGVLGAMALPAGAQVRAKHVRQRYRAGYRALNRMRAQRVPAGGGRRGDGGSERAMVGCSNALMARGFGGWV